MKVRVRMIYAHGVLAFVDEGCAQSVMMWVGGVRVQPFGYVELPRGVMLREEYEWGLSTTTMLARGTGESGNGLSLSCLTRLLGHGCSVSIRYD